jgi:hypothetical protein
VTSEDTEEVQPKENEVEGDTSDASTLFTATLAQAPMTGVSFVTSSGVEGVVGEDGSFVYNEGDSITFMIDGVEITIPSESIGDDMLITMDEVNVYAPVVEEVAQEEVTQEDIVVAEATAVTEDTPQDDQERVGRHRGEGRGSHGHDDSDRGHGHSEERDHDGDRGGRHHQEQTNGANASDVPVYTAALVEPPIDSITYITSSGLEGVLGEDGSFIYSEGDSITFTISGVEITIPSESIGDDMLITMDEVNVFASGAENEVETLTDENEITDIGSTVEQEQIIEEAVTDDEPEVAVVEEVVEEETIEEDEPFSIDSDDAEIDVDAFIDLADSDAGVEFTLTQGTDITLNLDDVLENTDNDLSVSLFGEEEVAETPAAPTPTDESASTDEAQDTSAFDNLNNSGSEFVHLDLDIDSNIIIDNS